MWWLVLLVIPTCVRSANDDSALKYIPKLKMAHLYFSAGNSAPGTVAFPKFGSATLSNWTYSEVAAKTYSIVYVCLGDIYLNRTTCISSEHGALPGPSPYAAKIEGNDAIVTFDSTLDKNTLYYPDPWGSPKRCVAGDMENEYTCLLPENSAVLEFRPDGTRVVWAVASASNNESILVAIVTIVAFAALLPHSRVTTEQAEQYGHMCRRCVVPIQTSWQKIICGDFVAVGFWSLIMKVIRGGVLTLVHPNLAVLFDDNVCVHIAFALFFIVSLHASHVLVTALSGIYQPSFRASYECVLLSVIVFMIPIDVAPQFHALFQFCLGCTLVFVVGRDLAYAGDTGIATVLYLLSVAVVAFVFMLPLLVECDAIPAETEIAVAITVAVQVAVLGITGTSKNSVGEGV